MKTVKFQVTFAFSDCVFPQNVFPNFSQNFNKNYQKCKINCQAFVIFMLTVQFCTF